jgi:hypothetical protein
MNLTCELAESSQHPGDDPGEASCCFHLSEHGLEIESDHEVPVGTTLTVGISHTCGPASHVPGKNAHSLHKAGVVVDCHPSPRHRGSFDLTIFFLENGEIDWGTEMLQA